MELMSWIHNTKVRGRIYELSAVVTCRSCKGVVVIVLTDDDRKLLSYGTMVGWFYDLHTSATTCPGRRQHTDEHGWGYYWNLDQVLRTVHPLDSKIDLERRGGRPHFGADFVGSYPKVHITSTASPHNTEANRPRPGSGMPHTHIVEESWNGQ
jgi:hypothetical protein